MTNRRVRGRVNPYTERVRAAGYEMACGSYERSHRVQHLDPRWRMCTTGTVRVPNVWRFFDCRNDY